MSLTDQEKLQGIAEVIVSVDDAFESEKVAEELAEIQAQRLNERDERRTHARVSDWQDARGNHDRRIT